ncbi:ImmA/IrrE family metallo-endopeptidase [Delftia acidovorans]|uniref:ImmA/IrrE family metallo-endopeptidase n=1 Tax=Delftia acidovorans TaxID=80866 RepID=UPI0033428268
MTTLSLAPEVLQWAAGNIGSTVEQLAVRVASAAKTQQVLEGKLTAKQAEKFASLAQVPFGFLFLQEPPELPAPEIPDLRQVHRAKPLSKSFFDTLRDVKKKQEWYSEFLVDCDADRPKFVGKFDPQNSGVAEVANAIKNTIGCDKKLRQDCANKEQYFAELVKRVELAGILVFKNGVVQNNGHRALSVDEFRGFALVDDVAPAVFINGKDSPSAWIFTLMHEVAHIWFGESGVSANSASAPDDFVGIEKKCNQVAAEILTPEDEFLASWGVFGDQALHALPRMFKVSGLVVAKRALDLNLISKDKYLSVLKQTKIFDAKANEKDGGDFYKSVAVRNSKKLTQSVVSEAFAGRMLLRDAGALLNVSSHAVAGLYKRREV